MTVYVADEFFHEKYLVHVYLAADKREELDDMVRELGLSPHNRRFALCQLDHYELSPYHKGRAIKREAVDIPLHDFLTLLQNRTLESYEEPLPPLSPEDDPWFRTGPGGGPLKDRPNLKAKYASPDPPPLQEDRVPLRGTVFH